MTIRWRRMGLIGAVAGLWAAACAAQGLDGEPRSAAGPIEEARQVYQLTLANLARLDRRIAELEAKPDPDSEFLRLYRAYRDRLASEAEQQRRALEALGAPPLPSAPVVAGDHDAAARVAPWPDAAPPAMAEPETERLNRELSESLAAFDGLLMSKQTELAEEQAELSAEAGGGWSSATAEAEDILRRIEEGQGGGQGQQGQQGQAGQVGQEGQGGARADAGQIAGAGGQQGQGMEGRAEGGEREGMARAGRPGAEPGDDGEGPAGVELGDLGTEGGMGADGAERGGETAGGPGGRGAAEGGIDGGFPPGAGADGSGESGGESSEPQRRSRAFAADDDIVARQLREAAERETDPVLKEKLWREYEAYKRGSRP